MTRPRIRIKVMKKGTKKTSNPQASTAPKAKPAAKTAAAPKRKGLRKQGNATVVDIDEEETTSTTTKKRRVLKRAEAQAPMRQVRQPAAIKRLSDNVAYSAALQDRLNGTGKDNNAISSQGASGLSHLAMPMPLVLQLTMQVSGIPYSSVLEVAGDKGSRKSSFVMEMGRIISGNSYIAPNYAGWCDYISTETKFPDVLCGSIVGFPDELDIVNPDGMTPVMPFRCDDMNEWQSLIQQRIKSYKKTIDPKRQIPFLLAVDSLTAKLLKESYDAIEKEGHAGRAFSVEANSIKRFMSKVSKDMEDHPMIFLAVNHVAREKEPGKFQETRRKPGGRFMSYQETFDLDLKAVGKTSKRNTPEGYRYPYIHTDTVKMTVEKSSVGETGTSCVLFVDYTMSNRVELATGEIVEFDGEHRRRTSWCWGRSLCNLLCNENKNVVGRHRKMLDDVCKVRKDSPLLYQCPQISSKSMDGEKLGRLIAENTKIVEQLYQMYGVTKYPIFEPYGNYAVMRGGRQAANAKKEFDDGDDDA